MGIVNRSSLAATVDAVNEAVFYGRKLAKADRAQAAAWIASRQGRPGSYAGMFAPTAKDRNEGIRLFTGERFATRAGVAHVLGEEACRTLIQLNVRARAVRDVIERASVGILERMKEAEQRERNAGRPFLGEYCCGKCSVALWRHLAVGGLPDAKPERWLTAGMKALRAARDGTGRWGRYPFFYTLLALSEIDTPGARREMKYAAPTVERTLKRTQPPDRYAERRGVLAERILAKC